MNNSFIPLEEIKVARPCRADWSAMQGDDTTRHCRTCDKNVYNLSSLSRAEAEGLIAEKEGKLCVRFYQRADGTMLTDDCPIGVKIARRPFKWIVAGFAALIGSGIAVFGGQSQASTAASGDQGAQRLQALMGEPAPPPLMGVIACPAPTPTPAPTKPPAEKE